MISGFKNLIKLIVINIPAILMIVGFVLIVIAFFKISQIAGLLASGVFGYFSDFVSLGGLRIETPKKDYKKGGKK